MRQWGKNVQLLYIYISYYLANKLLRNYRHLTCNVTKLASWKSAFITALL